MDAVAVGAAQGADCNTPVAPDCHRLAAPMPTLPQVGLLVLHLVDAVLRAQPVLPPSQLGVDTANKIPTLGRPFLRQWPLGTHYLDSETSPGSYLLAYFGKEDALLLAEVWARFPRPEA